MQEEIEEYVLNFQREFCRKFGTVPKVQYRVGRKYKLPEVSFKELNGIADKIMFSDRKLRHLESVKVKKRYRSLVLIRQCIFKIAVEQGYTLQQTGDYFGGYDHATVLYGANNFNKLLEVHDLAAVNTFKQFENAIKDKYGHDGDVRHNL